MARDLQDLVTAENRDKKDKKKPQNRPDLVPLESVSDTDFTKIIKEQLDGSN